jgi:hypothetical protein
MIQGFVFETMLHENYKLLSLQKFLLTGNEVNPALGLSVQMYTKEHQPQIIRLSILSCLL